MRILKIPNHSITVPSPARLAVISMQDILVLATLGDNWAWRLDVIPPIDHKCWQKSQRLNQAHSR
ncbi:MAG: hypothetical protein Q9N02_03240 [Ghiorsea sp.]|nr:hypothetical protein [Ghiorsea sp.]